MEELTTEIKEEFIIDSLEKANWAFKKMAECDKRIAEKERLVETEKQRLEQWLEADTKADVNSKEYFSQKLIKYYIDNKELDDKFKLSTPYGKVTSRTTKGFEYLDEAKLIDHFADTDIVKIEKKLDKTLLKKVLQIAGDKVVDEFGEVLEGIEPKVNTSITVKAVEL